jgi:hypothetical protein
LAGIMSIKFWRSKRQRQPDSSIPTEPDHHRKYALKSFKIIGPSNANFTMADATSHDAASASIRLSQSSIGRITKPLIMH